MKTKETIFPIRGAHVLERYMIRTPAVRKAKLRDVIRHARANGWQFFHDCDPTQSDGPFEVKDDGEVCRLRLDAPAHLYMRREHTDG